MKRPALRTLLGVLPLIALAGGLLGSQLAAAGAPGKPAFEGSRAETERFIEHYRSIRLTPREGAILNQALSTIPAPCCSDYPAATCCCECNMARSVWGLAKHLIRNQGAGAEEVRAAAQAWFQAINPAGFSGDVCSTGGCNRPFRHNGCGGMQADQLIF